MKNKYIFRKNLFRLMIICFVGFVLEEAFFGFFMLNFVEEEQRYVFVMVMCVLVTTIPCMLFLLFNKYLLVNDESVTSCKLFKREQTIYWKDAAVTDGVVQTTKGSQHTLTISDGTNEITFPDVSEKDLTLIKELCKTARERYNTENLTF